MTGYRDMNEAGEMSGADEGQRTAPSKQAPGSIERELDRIREEYHQRAQGKTPAGRYGLFNEATLAHTQSVERALLGLLSRRGMTRLAEARVLDVGCGSGMQLRRFIDYGARPEHLFGIDLLPARIQAATALHPAIHWLTGSAHELPFEARSFDIVMCFTVFSSILDDDAQARVAAEMRRVRKDGGVIICHDFAYDNPRNSQVRGVKPTTIRGLLGWPGARMDVRRVTLAPPLARRIAPRAEWLSSGLERLQVLNTHVVALLY